MATTKSSARAGAVGTALLAVATLSHAAPTTDTSAPSPAAATTGPSTQSPGAIPAETPSHVAPRAVTPTLDIRAVATDNSGLTTKEFRRADVIGEVDAGLILRERGARVTLTGNVGLDFIGYARNTQTDRVLPRGQAELNAILVERAFFFDASAEAFRTRSDPLAPDFNGTTTANTVSTVSLRASPYFSHEFSPTLSATARSDTIVTRSSNGGSSTTVTPNGSTDQHQVVRLARTPTPLGFSLEASHEETTYQDRNTPLLRTDSARATLSAALDADLLAGVVGGRDHVDYAGTTINDSRYGIVAEWRPSARTRFDADVEHRFFGVGWDLHLRHRLPQAVVDFSLQRAPSANPASFGITGPDSDPATLLGALLSSRIPGEADRDNAVDTLFATRGLPTEFVQPVQIFSESAQLATRATMNLVLNGVRNTIFFSAYYAKAQALDQSAAALSSANFDSRQWGSSLGLFHRLAPRTSAGAEIAWTAIDALGVRAGDSSHQVVGTLSLTRQLSQTATLSCGLRHFSSRVVLDSSSTTSQVNENQAFAGLRMQY